MNSYRKGIVHGLILYPLIRNIAIPFGTGFVEGAREAWNNDPNVLAARQDWRDLRNK